MAHQKHEWKNVEMRELVVSSQRLVHFKKKFAIASFVLLDSMRLRATIVSVP